MELNQDGYDRNGPQNPYSRANAKLNTLVDDSPSAFDNTCIDSGGQYSRRISGASFLDDRWQVPRLAISTGFDFVFGNLQIEQHGFGTGLDFGFRPTCVLGILLELYGARVNRRFVSGRPHGPTVGGGSPCKARFYPSDTDLRVKNSPPSSTSEIVPYCCGDDGREDEEDSFRACSSFPWSREHPGPSHEHQPEWKTPRWRDTLRIRRFQ